jgi:hypothetical protein
LILASENLDLLVLGSRRWGPVKRLALGSTSERVIRHTACPVLVPPRTDIELGEPETGEGDAEQQDASSAAQGAAAADEGLIPRR